MNLFLILTALLSALAGIGRPVQSMSATVEASRLVTVAQAVAPVVERRVADRPDGYVAPAPLRLDLRMMVNVAPATVPERRRE